MRQNVTLNRKSCFYNIRYHLVFSKAVVVALLSAALDDHWPAINAIYFIRSWALLKLVNL